MISPVSSSTSSDPGLAALRPAPDDVNKKRDSASATTMSSATGASASNSAVVQLSSEAVRLSSQATTGSAVAPAPSNPGAASQAAGTGKATSSLAAVKKYADADTNHDGRVSVLEARAYDFAHPSIPKPEQDDDPPSARPANSDVKAYEEVARS